MPLVTIGPGKFRKTEFPPPGRRKIEIEMEATGAVDVFLVDVRDYDKWRSGRSYTGASFLRRRTLNARIESDKPQDDWYLIFENHSPEEVTVHYEVYTVP